MTKLIKWLYEWWVDELYVPDHAAFSIGIKHPELAPIWCSFLPQVMTLHIKTKRHSWQSHTFYGDN